MRWWFVLSGLLVAGTPARGEEPVLRLSALPSDAELMQLLWKRSPDAALARGRIGSARADHARALLLPNPSLDLSWNTIPVGPTNPAELPSPLANVPNYAVSVSVPLEIGKRGSRQEAAEAAARSESWQAASQLRERFYSLLDAVAEVAADEQRIAVLTDLSADAARLSELEHLRSSKGDASELDADRARLEEQKLQSSLSDQQEKLVADLRSCSELAGVSCMPFGESTAAAAFLTRRLEGAGTIEDRPDLKALRSQEAAAAANLRLGQAKAIPDPTVRVGYVRDQFVVSGNQQNSLFVGLNFPLPMFDHGQADAAAAEANAASSREARERLVEQGATGLHRVEAQLVVTEKRREHLRQETLPLARSIVDRLSAAVQRGAAPLQDLLLTKRSLGELLQASGDLDLSRFHLSVARARLVGATPLPVDLNP